MMPDDDYPHPLGLHVTENRERETGLPDWHRLSIRYDGIEIMSATVTCKRPENSEQMAELYRELLRMHEAPDMPDPEVLDDRFPNKGLDKPTSPE